MSAICPNGHTSQATDYCDTCGEPMTVAPVAPASMLSLPPSAAAAALAGPSECPNCATPAAAGALFCENCGYDFTTGSAPVGAAASVGVAAPPAVVALVEPAADPVVTDPAGTDPGKTDPAEGEPAEGDPAQGDPAEANAAEANAGEPNSAEADPAEANPGETKAGESDPGEVATGSVAAPSGSALPTPPIPGTDPWVAEVWIDPDWYAAQTPEDPLPSAGMPIVVPLRERSVLVGRPSTSRGITPQVDCGSDSGVSRRHCQLTTDGVRWWVEDLQSANGTYIGAVGEGVPTTPIRSGERAEIEDGSRLYLGGWTRLVVRKALPGEA